MAKKKISTIKDWTEVNEKLRVLSEKKIELNRAEGRQTLEINNIREKYNDITEGLVGEIKTLETDIERFCEQNKNEFLKDRTKRFSFGTISYRLVSSVKIPNVQMTVKALQTLKLFDCLKISSTPIKENLKTLDSGTLAKVGVTLVETDKISKEPVMDTIHNDSGEVEINE